MKRRRKPKIIIDTNLWISFLIGKKLSPLKELLINRDIEIIISAEITNEIRDVTQRPKLRNYFPQQKVDDFLNLLTIIATVRKVKKIVRVCRDPKDDFLLALSKENNVDFLITGDHDLLALKKYGKTKIINAGEFESLMSNQS